MAARRQTLRAAGRPDDGAGNLRDWMRRPARPMWYWPLPRVLDWWNGRRDGRAGIPWFEPLDAPTPTPTTGDTPGALAAESVEPTGVPAGAPAGGAAPSEPAPDGSGCVQPIIPPPYLRYLRGRAADAARAEWVRSEARIVRAQARVDQLRAGAASLLQALTDAKDHVAGLPIDPDETALGRRTYTDELRQRPPSLSQARRRGDHERILDAARSARREADDRYLAQCAEIARIEALIAAEVRVRTARILRIHEHMRRREASYWRHVVRHHPHGARLSGCLDPAAPDLPAWAVEGDGAAGPPPQPTPDPPDESPSDRPAPAPGARTGNGSSAPAAPGDPARQGGRA